TTRKDAKYAEEITTQQRNVFSKGEKLIRELLEISTQEEEDENIEKEELEDMIDMMEKLDIKKESIENNKVR
ncbi:10336_t:CDS:2, partial [Rhizophagus irregularis]